MTYRYRYVDYVPDSFSPPSKIYLYSFPVLRKTPRGAWIDLWGKEKFVLDGEGKRFAYETLAWAWFSLKIRKEKQIVHAKASIQTAEYTLDSMNKFSFPPNKGDLDKADPTSDFTFF